MSERPLTERLRSGFGGIVPPVCDEAANKLDELTLERDTLRTMIVEIYQVARRELYRLRALPAEDVTGRTLHEIEVLARFVKDAQEHIVLIRQIESR